MTLKVGMTHSVEAVVDKSNVASAFGSGLLDVLATPYMIALMEGAASQCIQKTLPKGQSSVGTHVNVSHDLASPIGTPVTATATVTLVDRRRVEFSVVATTPQGEIGKGTHTRFIIDEATFLERLGE